MIEIKNIKSVYGSLLNKIEEIKISLNYESKKKRLKTIDQAIILNTQSNISDLIKEQKNLKRFIYNIKKIKKDLKKVSEIVEFIIEFNCIKDNDIILEFKNQSNKLKDKINKIELREIFCKKHDNNNCYLDITAGSGGIEAQDWAKIILRMYLRWANHEKFDAKILNISEGELSGIKHATIKITGKYAFGWLRTESGVHRLVRKSPFNSNNKRHTSFISVFVYPEMKEHKNIVINDSDLKIDFYRSSGAGGQHVNKTESAVRITHIPTKIVVKCQSDRSQHKNKEQAMKQLKSKLYKLELYNKFRENKKIEDSKLDIRWGNQIRSYFLDSSLIKDIRTGMKTTDINSILNGKLNNFIKASLKAGF